MDFTLRFPSADDCFATFGFLMISIFCEAVNENSYHVLITYFLRRVSSQLGIKMCGVLRSAPKTL